MVYIIKIFLIFELFFIFLHLNPLMIYYFFILQLFQFHIINLNNHLINKAYYNFY